MARRPKALRFIDNLKKGYNALLGKELAGAIQKKVVGGVTALPIPSMKKGGIVKKTGLVRMHKGEAVLTVAQRKNLKKLLK